MEVREASKVSRTSYQCIRLSRWHRRVLNDPYEMDRKGIGGLGIIYSLHSDIIILSDED